MKHNTRISGRFATTQQKAENDTKKYKDLARYFQSIITGHYQHIRRLTEENKQLQNELNVLKARVALLDAISDHLERENVQTIQNDSELKIEPFMCEIYEGWTILMKEQKHVL